MKVVSHFCRIVEQHLFAAQKFEQTDGQVQ